MRKDPSINLHLGCSLAAMREMQDNQYDLAIVDPPYGLGQRTTNGGGSNSQIKFKKDLASKKWDESIPTMEYFQQLRRVSKNQIIWGGNYFPLSEYRCFIVWDKMTYIRTMSQVELAYTSFDSPARYIKINSNQYDRFHPTQKPIDLYKYCLENYAKEGDRILDTHLGSGSIACACYDLGFDLDAWEIDGDYFEKTSNRFQEYSKQSKLF
jgi:site-specific DNA-methyltransferase (adenine-specific)